MPTDSPRGCLRVGATADRDTDVHGLVEQDNDDGKGERRYCVDCVAG